MYCCRCSSMCIQIRNTSSFSNSAALHCIGVRYLILDFVLRSWKLYSGAQLDLFSDYDYRYCSKATSILSQLNWSSLEIRRQVFRLIMLYKIVHWSVALDLPNEIVLFNTITRGIIWDTVPHYRVELLNVHSCTPMYTLVHSCIYPCTFMYIPMYTHVQPCALYT